MSLDLTLNVHNVPLVHLSAVLCTCAIKMEVISMVTVGSGLMLREGIEGRLNIYADQQVQTQRMFVFINKYKHCVCSC